MVNNRKMTGQNLITKVVATFKGVNKMGDTETAGAA